MSRRDMCVMVVGLALGGCGPSTVGMDGDGDGSATGDPATTGTSGVSADASTSPEDVSGTTAGADSTGDAESGSSDTGSPWPRDEGPPTEGWFVFAGGPPDEPGECLYRWDHDDLPSSLMCVTGIEELVAAVPPRPGSTHVFAATEQHPLDASTATVWRVDALTGEQVIVDSWETEIQGEPSRDLQQMIPVDEDCVALQIRVLDAEPVFDQVRIACVDGIGGQDLIMGPNAEHLLGVLDDGRVLVEQEPGGLVIVGPTSADVELVSDGTDVMGVAHDGQRVAFTVHAGITSAQVGLYDQGVTTWMTDTIEGQSSLAFDAGGHVVASSGNDVLRWDGTDQTAATIVGDGGLGIVQYVSLDDALAFRAVVFDLHSGIGFLAGGQVSDFCGEEFNPGTPARLSQSDEVIAVFPERDAASSHFGHILSCRPNAEPIDLFDPFEDIDLHGQTLPMWN